VNFKTTGFLAAAALAAALSTDAGPETALGQFEGHADVGSPRLAGSAAYNAVSQEYTLTAAGANMWAARDEFHFAWKKMTGDFILQARVELLGKGVDPHRKLGWIVRSTLDDDSPYADAAIHGDGLTSLQVRKTKGAATEQVTSAITGADVVQLERKGSTYTMSVARFGEPFTVSTVADLALGDEVYAGLFLCSHNPDVVEKAVFRDVRIVRPAKDGFVPYRDYIGSHLEILDVASGHRQVVHSAADPFEAPNWTRDGRALIYNTSGRVEGRGRLFRFDLATRQPALIDTAFANRNNNDHVLSFDGTMLAISDQSQGDNKSTVYTVPVGGGTPKRITPIGPSYLHGWSPDGKFLVYTGGRNDESHPWVQLPPDAMTLGAPDSLSLPGPTAVALAAPVPNPARGSVVLRFRMPSPGRVQLGVYDLAGRLVRMCIDAELEAGEYLRGLDLAGVQPGIYFGILRAPRGVARRALVVTR